MPERILGGTKVLALIADPAAQARSPGLANGLLHRREPFGPFALLPMQVSYAALADVLAGLRQIRDFAGAIVSMPHKVHIVPLLDEITPQAQQVDAVNVIRKSDDGRLTGTVLDGEGFVGGLKRSGHRIEGASCLLVGAGGAASAIAFALAKYGCASLRIVNRTAAKAISLASRIRHVFPQVEVQSGIAAEGEFDLAINGTSLGMDANDPLPIPEAVVSRSAVVADCVIAPEMTRLLETAKGHGCAIQSGAPMLAAQMDMMLEFMGVE
ncbi:shikimate dehydrogenase [Noviherbaspirillum sp. UKPF54]|uniref:shikimate dehydrogenase family protein n=1 Tax=Noviherbaspirillum sp. UKPF54 TaxID=2601898 RepID=UPI0011B120B7|nr:shikimate dehydrogenase [Noviherbaspirillum sp. UKPF54]QDZ29353.1 shikimate dehydrogenase [Noviherbaspirillum sp. UKPF54]